MNTMTTVTLEPKAQEKDAPAIVAAPDTRDQERRNVRESAGTRARNHRVAMAVLTCVISMYFIGPFYAMAWMALVLAYEIAAPSMLATLVTRFGKTDPDRARMHGICLSAFGASIYVLGWLPSALTGHQGALYFAAIWTAAAMIHALVYNSNDKLVFISSIAPALAASFIVPFVTTMDSLWLPLVLALATCRMMYTTWTAHADRQALVSSVNLNRQQRKAAEDASKAKSQFLATMSHELRTPLNAVIGYAEILEEDLRVDGKDQGAEDAARIRRAARDLLALINEVLDFSKIEAGRMDIVEAPVDAAPLLQDVVETCRHIAEGNKSELTISVEGEIGTVLTDGPRLRQCLLNLVSNACKFTVAGRVSVTVRTEIEAGAEFLRFDVSDTGCGIPADQAKRLFQPFVQADGSFTRKAGGTGLGLVITRKLAQLMGGDVTFESTPGKGSVFTLRVGVGRQHIRELESRTEGPLVVVIEDEAAARDLICRALARLPFRVRCAANAREGLDFVCAEPAALAVLDIHLPDRSGWDLLAELKTRADTRETPVLVVSVDDDRGRALALGACDHILKPADRDQLAAAALRYARVVAAPAPASSAVEMIWDDSDVAAA